MISKQGAQFIKYGANGQPIETATYFGLSSDTKPTQGVGNGSVFVEMDTSKLYFFDEQNTVWREQ